MWSCLQVGAVAGPAGLVGVGVMMSTLAVVALLLSYAGACSVLFAGRKATADGSTLLVTVTNILTEVPHVLKVGFDNELLSFGYNVWACDADAVELGAVVAPEVVPSLSSRRLTLAPRACSPARFRAAATTSSARA